jgi:hypothetical protein
MLAVLADTSSETSVLLLLIHEIILGSFNDFLRLLQPTVKSNVFFLERLAISLQLRDKFDSLSTLAVKLQDLYFTPSHIMLDLHPLQSFLALDGKKVMLKLIVSGRHTSLTGNRFKACVLRDDLLYHCKQFFVRTTLKFLLRGSSQTNCGSFTGSDPIDRRGRR